MNITNILGYLKKHSVVAGTLAIVAVIVMIIAGRVASRNNDTNLTSNSDIKRVTLVPVSTFRNDASTVSADGVVQSISEVDLKSQISAPVARLLVSVGDSVYQGQVLVELQNADLLAQLEQARASLSLAKNSSGLSLDSARKSAIDKIKDSYSTVDGIVRSQLDQFLFTTASGEAPLSSYITDYKLADNIRSTRTDITNRFNSWKDAIDNLSSATSKDLEIQTVLASSKDLVSVVNSLLDNVSKALSDAGKSASASTVSTINTWKGIVSLARNSISGISASLTGADTTLSNVLSSQGSPAEAQVKIAEAGVKGLEAQVAKTIIRSPIAGKISALPFHVGELVSPGQLITTVVGGGGLEVKGYVSGEDISKIKKDDVALIEGKFPGVVISIAPSVSELNKKAEVRVSVTHSESSGLVIGQSVTASIVSNKTNNAQSESTLYRLPIQNVKIVPGDAYVFTVLDSKIVKNHVILDKVEGDFIFVKSGLTDDMKIISPVYELEEGQIVDAE